jgi:hypothetical protein
MSHYYHDMEGCHTFAAMVLSIHVIYLPQSANSHAFFKETYCPFVGATHIIDSLVPLAVLGKIPVYLGSILSFNPIDPTIGVSIAIR